MTRAPVPWSCGVGRGRPTAGADHTKGSVMKKKFVLSVAFLVGCLSLTWAEEFGAVITKVDNGKITFVKMKGKEKGDEGTLPTTDKVKVVKAKFNKDTKMVEAGDAIENGLKNDLFTKIGEKGVFGRIVTDDKGEKITEIRVFQGFGGKGKDKTDKTDK
jgi:hypothetical protein